jgi:hypothetical protein
MFQQHAPSSSRSNANNTLESAIIAPIGEINWDMQRALAYVPLEGVSALGVQLVTREDFDKLLAVNPKPFTWSSGG